MLPWLKPMACLLSFDHFLPTFVPNSCYHTYHNTSYHIASHHITSYMIHHYITAHRAASTQSLKGIFTVGITKGVTYILSKMAKRVLGWPYCTVLYCTVLCCIQWKYSSSLLSQGPNLDFIYSWVWTYAVLRIDGRWKTKALPFLHALRQQDGLDDVSRTG